MKRIPPSFTKKKAVVLENKPVTSKEEKVKPNKSNSNGKNIEDNSKDDISLKKEEYPSDKKETDKDQVTLQSNNGLDYINSVFGKKNNNSSSTDDSSKKENFGFG